MPLRAQHLLLLRLTTAVDYWAGFLIARDFGPDSDILPCTRPNLVQTTRKKRYLALSLGSNLGLLAFLKEFNFGIEN